MASCRWANDEPARRSQPAGRSLFRVLLIVLRQNALDLDLRGVDLVVEVLGGNTLGPVAEDDELLKIVARRHADAAAAAKLKAQALDILIRRLRLPGIDDVDVVVFSTDPSPCGTLYASKTRMSVQPR